jgi:Domain of unknown function (DUF4390)
MNWVNTTVSSTPCWKNKCPDGNLRSGGVAAFALAWLLLAALIFVPVSLHAETGTPAERNPAEITDMRLERNDEGIYLTVGMRLELSPIVEDALLKGIPMFFVAEAQLFRDRWYWYDKKLASQSRHLRLAYQPLTRRWRLNTSSSPITSAGLGLTLGQNFDNLPDALAAVQRIVRWKIAPASEVDQDASHNVDFRFRLDVSQLPRPFQIGAVGQSQWTIAVERNQRLTAENLK